MGLRVIGYMLKEYIQENGVTKVRVPEGVTDIEESAFAGCGNLQEIILPNSLEKIKEQAFKNCTGLQSITIPQNVSKMAVNAFQGCENLKNIHVSSKNRTYADVGGTVFTKTHRTLLLYPQGKFGAIYRVPRGVVNIGAGAFKCCEHLYEILLPDTLEHIGESAFYGCRKLERLRLPASLRMIEERAFANCENLARISIPEGVAEIPDSTFYDCKKLMDIQIPPSVSRIGGHAFSHTAWLRNNTAEFVIINNILVSCKSAEAEIRVPHSVKHIASGAFYPCKNLHTLIIPDSVTEIAGGLYNSGNNVRRLYLTDAVTALDIHVLRTCFERLYFTSGNMTIEIDGSVLQNSVEVFCEFICSKSQQRREELMQYVPEKGTRISLSILLYMQHKSRTAMRYLQQNVHHALLTLIQKNQHRIIADLLPVWKLKGTETDPYLEYAIRCGAVECQSIFLRYKQDNGGYGDPSTRFNL